MENEETGTKKRMRGRAAALLLAVFCALISITGCEQPGGPPGPPEEEAPEPQLIDYLVQADGENGVTVSTKLVFAFDKEVSGLSVEDITLTSGTGSVTLGSLSGNGQTWSLAVTVVQAGDIRVRISKEGVSAEEKTTAVYKKGETVTLSWEVKANGRANTETTSALTFTFSGTVTGLSAADITLANDTGRASAVDFTSGLLLMAVEQAGNISVSINKEGIEAGPKTVRLCRKIT
jgi:hypothetical protein